MRYSIFRRCGTDAWFYPEMLCISGEAYSKMLQAPLKKDLQKEDYWSLHMHELTHFLQSCGTVYSNFQCLKLLEMTLRTLLYLREIVELFKGRSFFRLMNTLRAWRIYGRDKDKGLMKILDDCVQDYDVANNVLKMLEGFAPDKMVSFPSTKSTPFPYIHQGSYSFYLGAAPIMEGMAYLHQLQWSYRTKHEWGEVGEDVQFLDEAIAKRKDPLYTGAISMVRKALGPAGYAAFPMLADLSLLGPMPRWHVNGKPDIPAIWEDIHPGWRFVRALLFLKDLKRDRLPISIYDSERYAEVVERICNHFNWPLPEDIAKLWLKDLRDRRSFPTLPSSSYEIFKERFLQAWAMRDSGTFHARPMYRWYSLPLVFKTALPKSYVEEQDGWPQKGPLCILNDGTIMPWSYGESLQSHVALVCRSYIAQDFMEQVRIRDLDGSYYSVIRCPIYLLRVSILCEKLNECEGMFPSRRQKPLSCLFADAFEHDIGCLPEKIESVRFPSSCKEYPAHEAVVLRQLGKNDLAETFYKIALKCDPQNGDAHYNYANLLKDLSDYEGAESEYLEAAKCNEHDYQALGNLGEILLRQGRLKEGRRALIQALQINPNYKIAILNLGKILADRNHFKYAERCFQRAIEIDPLYEEAHVNLIIIILLAKCGRSDEVEWHCLKHKLDSESLQRRFVNYSFI